MRVLSEFLWGSCLGAFVLDLVIATASMFG